MNAYEIYLDSIRRDFIEPLSEHIMFEAGLTWQELDDLETFWEIRFPKVLRDFYTCAFPAKLMHPAVYPWNPNPPSPFPDWRNRSEENVKYLRELLDRPVKDLVHAIKRDGWMCQNWQDLTPEEVGEAAPRLIPLYGHRFMLMYSCDSPVFSIADRDVVYYGSDFFNWLKREFLESAEEKTPVPNKPYVPVWGDIPGEIRANLFPNPEIFLEIFMKTPLLLNESEFCFVSDPISPKQKGYRRERMIGWCESFDKPYWIGGCDDKSDTQFDTAEELLDAPVFDGKSLRARWNEVAWITLMSLNPNEWLENYLRRR